MRLSLSIPQPLSALPLLLMIIIMGMSVGSLTSTTTTAGAFITFASAARTASQEQNTYRFLMMLYEEFGDVLRPLWTLDPDGAEVVNCNWRGVNCSEFPNDMIGVNLQGMGLSGEIPELEDYEDNDDDHHHSSGGKRIDGSEVMVASINLSENPRLQGDLPEDWARLRRLQFIDLSDTRAEGSIPDEWAALTELQSLDLERTRVDDDIPTSLMMLKSLRVLTLGETRVEGRLSPLWGAAFPNLQILSLAATDVEGPFPASWAAMTSLRELNLSRLEEMKDETPPLWAPPQLQTLDLKNDRLRCRLPSMWARMKDLTVVDLTGNNFCGCVPPSWAGHAVLTAAARAADPRLLRDDCETQLACDRDCISNAVDEDGGGGGGGGSGSDGSNSNSNSEASGAGSGSGTDGDSSSENSSGSGGETNPTPAPPLPTYTFSAHTYVFLFNFLRSFPELGVRSSHHGWGRTTDYCSWSSVKCEVVSSSSFSSSYHSSNSPHEATRANASVSAAAAAATAAAATTTAIAVGDTVVTLDLSRSRLNGRIPEMPPGVDPARVRVKSINLSGNPLLYGRLQPSWARIPTLESVDLSVTSVTGPLPRQWLGGRPSDDDDDNNGNTISPTSAASSLHTINVSHTRITGVLPDGDDVHPPAGTAAGGAAFPLRSLDVSYCPLLVGAFPENDGGSGSGGGYLSRLTTLRMARVHLCGCMPASWRGNAVLEAAAQESSGGAAAVATNCQRSCDDDDDDD